MKGFVPSDEALMRLAIAQAELARGNTGDNPWVGCVIASPQGQLLGAGFTRGPGEHHAEISAAADAAAHGHSIAGATLYSTLEPCSFHGRTPACAHTIVSRGLGRVVLGIRDPNPKVDGAGLRILRAGGIQVLEGICSLEISRQLGPWIARYHPHLIIREAGQLSGLGRDERHQALATRYAISPELISTLIVD
jgi:diaminohydroxyphosphoribosylaminopyrimidine deaminase / 5-amino-6-(5-phosphoribosylamino)uracil reductase